MAVLELLAREDQTLLIRRDPFLVLNGGPPIYVVFIPVFVVNEIKKLQNPYIIC